MDNLQKKAITLLAFITFATGTLIHNTTEVFAAGVSAHIRIVGTNRTIWYGDVEVTGCTVTDSKGTLHTLTQPFAICAVDKAAKTGNFTYRVKDYGGSLGLFLEGIAEDVSSPDFSTYWLYDVNGAAASVGASSYTVKSGDSLFFHFENPVTDINKRAINDGISYLRSQQETNGQISGFPGVSGWAAMAFAAADINPATVSKKGVSLLDYLAVNPPASSSQTTDWERAILAITAAGANPYNFGGIDYVSNLETYHNNYQLGSTSQVNDDIFGLLALVSAGSGVSDSTKQDAFNFILSHQNSDGGFSWSTTGASDVDDTAAALQALAAYQNSGISTLTLVTAITDAKNFILNAKNSDGGFPYTKGDLSNTSTTSWVIMALNSIGYTGQESASAKSYVRSNQEENGSFRWQTSSNGETFTTSYAILAFTGNFWPVKVFAGTTSAPSPTQVVSPTSTPSPTIVSTPMPTSVPTETPEPSVVLSASPTPSVFLNSNPYDRYKEIVRLEKEKMQDKSKEQKLLIEKIREQIQKKIENLLQLVKNFRKQ